MKILFFGDVVARPGREALRQVLPGWREQYQPDAIIGNVENLAHGKGITQGSLDELLSLGFSAFTSGDHIFARPGTEALLQDERYAILRPANYPPGTPGRGSLRLKVGSRELLLVNLLGQVFMDEDCDSPFRVVDELLRQEAARAPLAGIIIDIHAEATSEKVALGWYLDGRASAVVGTHTHIPTADAWLLPHGTAYITDLGMTGIRESVIGVKTDIILKRFLTQLPARHEPAETGTAVVSAALITIDQATGQATAIERLATEVTIG